MKNIFIIGIIIVLYYYSYCLLFVKKSYHVKVNRINKIVCIKIRKLNKNIDIKFNKFNRIFYIKFKKLNNKNNKILTKTQNNLEIIIITKWELLVLLLDFIDI